MDELLSEFSATHNVSQEALGLAAGPGGARTLLQKQRMCNTILDRWVARTEGNNLAYQVFHMPRRGKSSLLQKLGNTGHRHHVTEDWVFDSEDPDEHDQFAEWHACSRWLDRMPSALDKLRWHHYYKFTATRDDRITAVPLLKHLFVFRGRALLQHQVSPQELQGGPCIGPKPRLHVAQVSAALHDMSYRDLETVAKDLYKIKRVWLQLHPCGTSGEEKMSSALRYIDDTFQNISINSCEARTTHIGALLRIIRNIAMLVNTKIKVEDLFGLQLDVNVCTLCSCRRLDDLSYVHFTAFVGGPRIVQQGEQRRVKPTDLVVVDKFDIDAANADVARGYGTAVVDIGISQLSELPVYVHDDERTVVVADNALCGRPFHKLLQVCHQLAREHERDDCRSCTDAMQVLCPAILRRTGWATRHRCHCCCARVYTAAWL